MLRGASSAGRNPAGRTELFPRLVEAKYPDNAGAGCGEGPPDNYYRQGQRLLPVK